jgi:hypothetical protein
MGEGHLVRVIDRAADADLDGPPRVDQPLLDGPPERRAVGVAMIAEIAVVGVGMRVEMNEAERPVLGDGAQDRQRREMVAAGAERHHALGVNAGEEPLDPGEAVGQVDRIARRVADIGDPRQLVGGDPADMVDLADEARHVADLARPMARPGAVGGAAIPRHADQRDVELSEVGDVGQPHKGRNRAVARRHQRVDRLRVLRLASHRLSPRRWRPPDAGRAGGAFDLYQ